MTWEIARTTLGHRWRLTTPYLHPVDWWAVSGPVAVSWLRRLTRYRGDVDFLLGICVDASGLSFGERTAKVATL